MITSVSTKIGRKKLAMARAGEIAVPKVLKMAFGRGGIDENGNVISPSESENALNDEIIRIDIQSHVFPVETTCKYKCIIGKDELVGESITEIGLVDEDGDIVAIKNFLPKVKDEGMEMIFEIEDEF